MVIEVTYNVTDVYMSTTVSPIYITVDYSGSGGSGASVWGSITGTLSNQTDLQTALDAKFDDPTGTTLQYIDGTGALQTFPTALDAINLITEVYNQSGATITKGTVVYINGGHGNLPTIAKAIATSDATSAQTFGIVREDITNMNNGYVIQVGLIENLNTSAYSDGTQLYLSGTTAGGYTSTKPYAPIHLVYIGIVVRSHPTQGTIQIKIQNGYELDELHNVSAQSPSNKDGIFYNSGNGLWENKSIGTVLGYTPEQPLTFSSPLARSTNTVSINAASSSSNGYLSSTDWSTFNGKQNALTNPVTGTGTTNELAYFSGTSAISSLTTATYPSLTELSYVKGVTSAVQTQLNAKGNGTVTSVAALTLGTTGTDLSSTVANGTTTPVITLNIPTASATNRGALSSTDWSTFNSKQGALTLTTTGTSGAATLVGNTLNIPQYSGGGGMAIGGSITSATAGSVLFAGTSGVLAQDNSNLFWDNTNKRLGVGANTFYTPTNIDWWGGTAQEQKIFLKSSANTKYTSLVIAGGASGSGGGAIQFVNYTGTPVADFGTADGSEIGFAARQNTANINFYTTPSGTSPSKRMSIFASGNVLLQNGGTFTDAGYRLDVNGTMRVQDNITLNKNQSIPATITLNNTASATNAGVAVILQTDASSGNFNLGKWSSTNTPYKIVASGDAYFYNTLKDIAILNDASTGAIKFAAGGSSTAHMTIKSNGRINMSSLPTSATGLSTGDLWNDAGTLKIV